MHRKVGWTQRSSSVEMHRVYSSWVTLDGAYRTVLYLLLSLTSVVVAHTIRPLY